MSTYGEFIDEVRKIENVEGQFFVDEWMTLASEEEWATLRNLPLNIGLVRGLVQDMQTYFIERLQSICTDALYKRVIEAGHTFLKELHTIAVRLGMTIGLQEIDEPLTPSDAINRS